MIGVKCRVVQLSAQNSIAKEKYEDDLHYRRFKRIRESQSKIVLGKRVERAGDRKAAALAPSAIDELAGR
jgi:hypothetical protein